MAWTPDKNDKAMIAASCGDLGPAEREKFEADVCSRLQSMKNVTKNHVRAAITQTLSQGK
jgi:hypothetical protein